jgi:hypothetical protein
MTRSVDQKKEWQRSDSGPQRSNMDQMTGFVDSVTWVMLMIEAERQRKERARRKAEWLARWEKIKNLWRTK